VISVAFSADGALLASSSDDATVRLWRVSSQTQAGMLTGYPSRVDILAFSPDGALLASGGWDGTIRFWGVPRP
jgi:WD40 repeat protein